MGTQQILLIVLSVIIVGAAIAVGIQMFNNQAYSANKSAIAADAQSYAAQVVQYYKTPASQGGGSNSIPESEAEETIAGFIGFMEGSGETGAEWGTDIYGISNENGIYTITAATPGEAGTVEITGVGKEVKSNKSPNIVTTITFPEGTISAVASDA